MVPARALAMSFAEPTRIRFAVCGVGAAAMLGLSSESRADGASPEDRPSVQTPGESSDASALRDVRTFRIVQITGGVLFGATYVASLLAAALFHSDGQTRSEKRHVGYLAYPVAGPFIGVAALDGVAPVLVPLGVVQGLGAVGFVVGTVAIGSTSKARAASVELRPTTGLGAELALGMQF